MIISATFSKPAAAKTAFDKEYIRIKAKAVHSNGKTSYFMEAFTEKQAFHFSKTEDEMNDFIEKNAGITFKSCVIRTESEEIQILANKKGKITRLTRKLSGSEGGLSADSTNTSLGRIKNAAMNNAFDLANGTNKVKNYILKEGNPVPFLVLLGIMTPEGKVISSKYDKFRQINRFLEFIDDIIDDVVKNAGTSTAEGKQKNSGETEQKPLRVVDFGCGKSYLTFAVHYFLTEIKKIPAEICGLDLKQDVIDYCNKIAERLNLKNLTFETGNISGHSYKNPPDLIITLHACDTATDFALDYAVKNGCSGILSVPCCQHEINSQLDENLKHWKKEKAIPEDFSELLKYGIIKERFSALLTDSIRANYLEKNGYSVQLLEFISMDSTPKNLLIRAVKKGSITGNANASTGNIASENSEPKISPKIVETLKLAPTILKL